MHNPPMLAPPPAHAIEARMVEDLWHIECNCGWRVVACQHDLTIKARRHLRDNEQ